MRRRARLCVSSRPPLLTPKAQNVGHDLADHVIREAGIWHDVRLGRHPWRAMQESRKRVCRDILPIRNRSKVWSGFAQDRRVFRICSHHVARRTNVVGNGTPALSAWIGRSWSLGSDHSDWQDQQNADRRQDTNSNHCSHPVGRHADYATSWASSFRRGCGEPAPPASPMRAFRAVIQHQSREIFGSRLIGDGTTTVTIGES